MALSVFLFVSRGFRGGRWRTRRSVAALLAGRRGRRPLRGWKLFLRWSRIRDVETCEASGVPAPYDWCRSLAFPSGVCPREASTETDEEGEFEHFHGWFTFRGYVSS